MFATFSGIYFWFPKMTGRFLDEGLGKFHFWTTFIGFHLTFLVQHWLGTMGMPRRYPDYLPTDGFTTLNTISTIGSFILGASILPFLWNIVRTLKHGEVTTADDPWGYGNSLEWATSSPPPRHNFTSLPRIRSERPAFELHHPHLLQRHAVRGPPATPVQIAVRLGIQRAHRHPRRPRRQPLATSTARYRIYAEHLPPGRGRQIRRIGGAPPPDQPTPVQEAHVECRAPIL